MYIGAGPGRGIYDKALKIQILISEGHTIVSSTATHHCLCLVHSVHFKLLECMGLTVYFDIDVVCKRPPTMGWRKRDTTLGYLQGLVMA